MVPHLKWGCVTWAPLSPRPAGSECRDLPNEFLKAPWFGEALNQMTLEPLGTSAVSVELCFFSGPCLMWGNCTPRALSWALGGGGLHSHLGGGLAATVLFGILFLPFLLTGWGVNSDLCSPAGGLG